MQDKCQFYFNQGFNQHSYMHDLPSMNGVRLFKIQRNTCGDVAVMSWSCNEEQCSDECFLPAVRVEFYISGSTMILPKEAPSRDNRFHSRDNRFHDEMTCDCHASRNPKSMVTIFPYTLWAEQCHTLQRRLHRIFPAKNRRNS